MIYVLEKEGEKKIEVHFPKQIEEDVWVVEQDDFEFRESTTYTFDDEDQAMFFLETHIESFKTDGYKVHLESPLTDD
mgnify:CR=1 FL=1